MNYFEKLSRIQVLLLGWVYTVAFYGNRLLSNTSTPGGDAKRSLGYFETAKESSSYLPLWDPFAAMGKPAFADPEWLFYRIIAPLFNAIPRDYYNLIYNLVLLILLMVLLFVIYSLSRALKIDHILSGFIATLAVCSGFAWSSVESGRLNTLVILISTFALIPLYRHWFTSKKAITLVALVLSIATNLVLSGYYAIVAYAFFTCFVYGLHLEHLKSYSRALFISVKHLAGFGLLALLLSSILVLPMMESQLSSLVTSTGWGSGFSALSISSAARLFVPFFAEQPLLSSVFPYIGFLLLPGLFGFFLVNVSTQNKALLCLLIFSLVCFLLAVGLALPAPYFDQIYNAVPILNLIRWGQLYAQYSMLILILISVLGFSQIKQASQLRRTVSVSMLLVLISILIAEAFFDTKPDLRGLRIQMAALAFLFMLSTWLLCVKFSGKSAVYGILLIGLCLHLVTPRAAFFSNKSLIETPRTNNLIGFKGTSELTQKFTLGLRQYCLTMASCPLSGVPGVYGANGFSMFFPESTRVSFSYISNKQIDAQRPHWVKRVRCPDLSLHGLEMANIKLIFCNGELKPPGQQWRSLLKTEEGSLWFNNNEQSPLHLFYSTSKVEGSMSLLNVDEMWNNNVLSLDSKEISSRELNNSDPQGDVEILDWNDDSYTVSVDSSEPVYLFSSVIFNQGWSAKVNSSKVPILNAFSAYQAIRLPAGNSVVEFNYEPLTWPYAKWLSIFSLLLVVLLALVLQSRNSVDLVTTK